VKEIEQIRPISLIGPIQLGFVFFFAVSRETKKEVFPHVQTNHRFDRPVHSDGSIV
jgi:hypothetical protein